MMTSIARTDASAVWVHGRHFDYGSADLRTGSSGHQKSIAVYVRPRDKRAPDEPVTSKNGAGPGQSALQIHVHTEAVGGSIPVSPTTIAPGHRLRFIISRLPWQTRCRIAGRVDLDRRRVAEPAGVAESAEAGRRKGEPSLPGLRRSGGRRQGERGRWVVQRHALTGARSPAWVASGRRGQPRRLAAKDPNGVRSPALPQSDALSRVAPVITGELKSKIDRVWDAFWSDLEAQPSRSGLRHAQESPMFHARGVSDHQVAAVPSHRHRVR